MPRHGMPHRRKNNKRRAQKRHRRHLVPHTKRAAQVLEKVLAAVSLSRREKLDLRSAAKIEGTRLSTILRYAPSAVQRHNGTYRVRKVIRVARRKAITDPRVARALGFMRRERVSASEAARREKMKLETFRKGAGRFLYRSGPGKPWKARNEDQLRFSMTVLTSRGPLDVIVSDLRERKLLHDYDSALRMFRAGEDGAEAPLKEFEGKTVGGQTLVTDIKLLIELEEAGQLDYEGFYTAIGSRS